MCLARSFPFCFCRHCRRCFTLIMNKSVVSTFVCMSVWMLYSVGFSTHFLAKWWWCVLGATPRYHILTQNTYHRVCFVCAFIRCRWWCSNKSLSLQWMQKKTVFTHVRYILVYSSHTQLRTRMEWSIFISMNAEGFGRQTRHNNKEQNVSRCH